MRNKQVLIVGSGGREHALARQFAKSSQVKHVWVAPGNPGMVQAQTEAAAAIQCAAIDITEFEALANFVVKEAIDVTFVGPEIPLNLGIVDYFNDKQLAIVGPTRQAAQLEASKTFAKQVMQRAGVKTAQHQTFSPAQFDEAKAYLGEQEIPVVLKQDGLAQGKGVVIAESMAEAQASLDLMMNDYGSDVVIEECLVGQEFSHFSLVNGAHIMSIGSACDYKRAFDGDKGPNTGGMGAFAPVDWVDEDLNTEIENQILQPLSQQMITDGTPFTGVLYTGLMKTAKGLYVIEFNTRFGDPETQILLPLLETDFYDIVTAHLKQKPLKVQLVDKVSLGVVVAAAGYPKEFQKGMAITVNPELPREQVFYAGVEGQDDNSKLLSCGGRILMVTAQADTKENCRQAVYRAIQAVEIPNVFYRTDIGL